MTQAVTAKNAYLAVKIDGVWERFHEVKTTPEVGESADKIDATSLDSEMKEYIKDIPDQAADLEFTMNAIPTGKTGSNFDLLKRMDKDGTYEFKYGLPQMGIYYIIVAQFSWKLGGGTVSAVQEITLTLIPKSRPNDTPITSKFAVTYDPNGGTGSVTDSESPYDNGATVTVKDSTGITAPDSKTFLCWNTDKNNMGQSYDAGDRFNIYNDVTLYAIWSE